MQHMKCKPSRNSHVGHLNLIHGSTKIRYVGLNWFKRWSLRVLNCRDWVWYMKMLTFELGLSKEGVFEWSHRRVLSMQPKVRNQWKIQGVGPGVWTLPIRPDACLSSGFFNKAVFHTTGDWCSQIEKHLVLSVTSNLSQTKFSSSF